MRERRLASALRYDGAGSAPRVVASGAGMLADCVVERAEAAGVPVLEDAALAQALAALDLGENVPHVLYQAVAEALLWALELDRRVRPSGVREELKR